MKQAETCFGRGFESRLVHHKDTMEDKDERARVDVKTPWFKLAIDNINWKEILVVAMVLLAVVYIIKGQYVYDGPVMVSTGQIVSKWTTRKAKDVILANQIDANDDYFYQDLKLAA